MRACDSRARFSRLASGVTSISLVAGIGACLLSDSRKGADDDVANLVLVQRCHYGRRVQARSGGLVLGRSSRTVHGHRVAPGLKLPVAMTPLGLGAASLQAGQYLVMRIVCGQVQAQVESRRAQQPKQRSQRGLPLVTLVCRDHCDWDSSTLGQFPLAQAGLQPGQLQERR